jgi:hypothetical protein
LINDCILKLGDVDLLTIINNLNRIIYPFPSVEEFNDLFNQICPMKILDENSNFIAEINHARIVDYDLKLVVINRDHQKNDFKVDPSIKILVLREAIQEFFKLRCEDKMMVVIDDA